jgi:phosphoribosylformylglycinamidine synthase
MMACAIDEAIRNAVAVGGNLRHMAGVDNFCWCDPVQSERTPDGHYKLAQLVRANQALAHFCQGYGVPCISGKDSMKNDYFMEGFKISIPPTVLFSVISVVPAVERCLSSDFKKPGDGLYILGMTKRELGRSEFAAEIQDRGGEVPQVDLLSARERYLTFYQVVQEGLVNACHDISDGGLAVALAEMAIGGGLGAEVHLDEVPVWPEDLKLEEILYSETASRLVVTVPREGQRSFERRNAHQVCQRIGEVKEQPKLTFFAHDERYLQDDLDELNKAWKGTLDW